MIEAMTERATLPRVNRDSILDKETDIEERFQEFAEYVGNLVKTLQEKWLRQLKMLANLQLQLTNVGVFYFDLPDADGVYLEGAVRLKKTAAYTVEMQVTDASGTWLTGTDAMATWSY